MLDFASQIKDDSMLEDLNSVLNNGDVPNIYKVDEMETIFHSMRGHVQEAGLQINRSNLFSAYVKTVRNNLHVVITMRYSSRFSNEIPTKPLPVSSKLKI